MATTSSLSNSQLANLVKQWKPSNEWDYDKNNKYAGTNIRLADGTLVPYDAIVQQVLTRYDQDKKNPTLAVKSGIELGISDDILKTLPGVDENALAAGKQLLASGAFNTTDTGEGRAGFVQPAAPGSDTYKARMAAGLDAYGYPPAQVEALRASGQYREPTTSLADIAQVSPAASTGGVPLSNITAPASQSNQVQTGTDRAGNAIYSTQPAATQNAISAADFVEPSWAKNARQTIGTGVEPVYPMKTVHGGNQVPDTEAAPIGYRYDNGKSQYQYLDLAGTPTNLVNRGNLGEAIKTLAPIGLSMIGANFLAPALGDLFGADVLGATTGGTTGGLGGVAGSAGNVLSAVDIAAMGGADIAGLSGTAASNLAASVAGGMPALEAAAAAGGAGLAGAGAGGGLTSGAGGAGTSLNEMVASGLTPGSVGATGAVTGALTPEALAAAAGTGLGTAIAPAATQLTPAALESLSGTAGYGTNASAVNAAINAGINPAIVGSGAGLTVADLLAGTTGAAGAAGLPATTSLNEMIASGTGPGSAGAYGATTGALTGADLAAAGGLVTAGSTLADLAAAGAAGVPAATPSINEMVASGLGPGAAGAAGAAAGTLTGDALAAAAGTGLTSTLGSGLIDTLVQKAKDAISTGSSAATSLVDQLKNATGLTGTQLATLLSGGVGAGNAANLTSAINTGLDATTAANTASQGVLKDIYNQQLGFQAPYQATGVKGLNQINQLADTGYLTHQFNAADLAAGLAPNYDFMLQQGQMANQRAANVGGGALSGNTLQGLQNYTQNYAGNAYQNAFTNYQNQRNNIYTNLAGMAGIGQTANTGAQAAGTSYGKGTTDLQTALANAQAAAAIGKAQAASQGTTGLANSTFLASLLAPPK
jgi:hypothetical protein